MPADVISPQRSTLSYFKFDFIALVLAMVAGYFLGGFSAALSVLVLSILEISLSFDNAIVNAKILAGWSPAWRKAFLYGGILIAALGMRFAFPLIIVMAFSHMSISDVWTLALHNPQLYSERLEAVSPFVTAFGGSFLFMIALGFFFDAAKDNHWIPGFENICAFMGKFEAIQTFITLAILVAASRYLVAPAQTVTFLLSGIFGLMTFFGVEALGTLLGGDPDDESEDAKIDGKALKGYMAGGLGGFLYIEMLDASFSFDGVIGAFAVTSSIFIILLGNGVGAFFVRSMTMLAVDRKTLAEYRYLEHGAFYAILTLATLMFLKLRFPIPDVVTGLVGATLIVIAWLTSVVANREDDKLTPVINGASSLTS